MQERIRVLPLGWLARLADALMVPLMYVLSGTFRESPQRTHRWNNTKLAKSQVDELDAHCMVCVLGRPESAQRFKWSLPVFHAPILGGWRDYIVLEPPHGMGRWHVGWLADDAFGISRIPLNGPVRLLLGPGDVCFFGLMPHGGQIVLHMIGEGHIGDNGPHSHLPLL